MYRRSWQGIASSLRFKQAAGCCLLRISYRLRVLQSARIARSISTLVQIEYKKGPECRLSLGSKCPPPVGSPS